jgi:hypothetical protein
VNGVFRKCFPGKKFVSIIQRSTIGNAAFSDTLAIINNRHNEIAPE